jgi:hypothetical protein
MPQTAWPLRPAKWDKTLRELQMIFRNKESKSSYVGEDINKKFYIIRTRVTKFLTV